MDGEVRGRRSAADSFHVTQGVLTPDARFIVSHLAQKLGDALAGRALDPFVDWLRVQNCGGGGGVNVVTVDFLELTELVPILLRINRAMADRSGAAGIL